jgi:hypothetical protein
MTEDGRRMTEARGRKTEGGGAEVRDSKTGIYARTNSIFSGFTGLSGDV